MPTVPVKAAGWRIDPPVSVPIASGASNAATAAPEPPPERMERFAILGPLMEEHTPAEPHWYLQLLATHPDWQRRGISAALMNVMFERADADGLPCYLETETVENVAYYRHHGFDVRTEWDVPTAPHMWGMYRPAG